MGRGGREFCASWFVPQLSLTLWGGAPCANWVRLGLSYNLTLWAGAGVNWARIGFPAFLATLGRLGAGGRALGANWARIGCELVILTDLGECELVCPKISRPLVRWVGAGADFVQVGLSHN